MTTPQTEIFFILIKFNILLSSYPFMSLAVEGTRGGGHQDFQEGLFIYRPLFFS